MVDKVFDEGMSHSDTSGTLNRYITKLWFSYKHCNNVRIYGDNIYFFTDRRLITVYRLDTHLVKHANRQSK